MKLNQKIYYVHNFIMVFYAMIFVLGIFLYPEYQNFLGKTGLSYAFLIFFCLGVIHYQTAVEVAAGLNAAKIVSRIIAYLLLVCFPLGTCIGFYILFLTSKEKWQQGGTGQPNSKIYQLLFHLTVLCISLIIKTKDFFTIPIKNTFNSKLALYLRLSILWQTIAFIGVAIWKADVIFTNFLVALFFPCIWGMTVYYCYQYSLKVLSGDDQVRGKIRRFSIVLFIIYGQSILIIPFILIFLMKTSDKYWQSQKDIYLGKFYK